MIYILIFNTLNLNVDIKKNFNKIMHVQVVIYVATLATAAKVASINDVAKNRRLFDILSFCGK